MEKITRRQEGFYYGETKCSCADDAYMLFREDYHRSLGKNAYGRLNRLGAREERQHGYGFVFSERKECPISIADKVPVYILGIIAGGYCRVVGIDDLPQMTDEEYEQWVDYAFSKDSGALRTVGLKYKAGRTSKILNKRYR